MNESNERRVSGGFTLAELLIVVAIIAMLIAIAIPVFTTQLERSREAADLATVRAAYAELMSDVVSNDTSAMDADGKYRVVVSPLTQTRDGWDIGVESLVLGGVSSSSPQWTGEPSANGSCTVTYDPSDELVYIDWGSGASGGTGGGTSGSTTPAQAQAANAQTAASIETALQGLFTSDDYSPNAKVTIDVDNQGHAQVSLNGGEAHGNHNSITVADVEQYLRDKSILTSDGTVAYDTNDTGNGYTITLNNNGSGKPKIHIEWH